MRVRLVIALLAVLALPSAARAATVQIEKGTDVFPGDTTDLAKEAGIAYTSAAGETDNVSFSVTGGQVVVTEPGLTAGPGCTATTTGATCPLAGAHSLIVALLEGDDHLTVDPSVTLPGILDGGNGNDVMQGGSNGDAMYGGAGNDTLLGGDGNDYLYGDIGDDTLRGGVGVNTLEDTSGANRFYCGGPYDLIKGAKPNQLFDCKPPELADDARVESKFTVYSDGTTVPVRLRIRERFPGTGNTTYTLAADCKPTVRCGGMTFKDKQSDSKNGRVGYDDFRPRKGFAVKGVPGKRGVKPGAKFYLDATNGAGYTKQITYTARRGLQPSKLISCFDPAAKQIAC